MRHWRHHPDDDQLDITVEALIESKELFQQIIHQVKEAIMATLEEASAEATSVDAAVVAYVQDLQAQLATSAGANQAAVDAISAATASLQALLPVAPAPEPEPAPVDDGTAPVDPNAPAV